MGKQVVVLGGSIAGLGAAIGLARRGFAVTVIERDVAPETNDGDEAFLTWNRRNVPQFRQPHGFSARSRNLLLEHAPDVVERLCADGVDTTNFFKKLAPPELWTEADDAFDGLMVRRPAFELALRRTAEATSGIEFVCPANASGLVMSVDQGALVPTVTGVRLADGAEVLGDVVLDCSGRRSTVPGWLAAAGVEVPYESQDCDTTYFTRYFRLDPESTMPMFLVVTINTEIEGAVQLMGFPGDHDAIGVCLATAGGDDDLRAIRDNDAWQSVLSLFPSAAPWVDPANATPINDVEVMAGSRNIRRHYVVDGAPLVRGLLPIGDSLCSTNPAYGWGASMALTYAFAAVDAITTHGDDLEKMALSYEAAVAPEADAVYRESAAMDRSRIYRWRGLEIPEDDRAEMERQDLIARGVGRGATRDPVLGRAFLRRSNLIDRPDAILDDPEVVEKATEMRARLDAKARPTDGLTRDDVLLALEGVKPAVAAS